MKTLFHCFLVLSGSLTASTVGIAATASPDPIGVSAPANFQTHPWSETSATFRVSKRFLNEVAFMPLTITNFDTMEFVLTEDLISLLRMTPNEAAKVTQSLSAALHEYRTVEGKHLEPEKEEPAFPNPPGRIGPPNPPAAESFAFKLTKFPDEAGAIRQKLKGQIAAALGPQRTEIFWNHAGPHLDGEMSTFQRPGAQIPPTQEITTYRFDLRTGAPPGVDLYKTTTSQIPGGGSGRSVSGRPHGPALDRYAPEVLKPVLARWRKSAPAADVAATATSAALPEVSPRRTPSSSESATAVATGPWDDRATFVDLPKTMLKALNMPGLTLDQELSAEAIAVFGLQDADVTAVHELYQKMRSRFEQLERHRFGGVGPKANDFFLGSFPQEAAALRDEWTRKLQALLGANRGQLLDQMMRTPASGVHFMRQMRREDRRVAGRPWRPPGADGPGWLQRGDEEISLQVFPGPEREGRPTVEIQWQSKQGGRGTFGGTLDEIPERWRHLLTPDVLGLPTSL